MTFLYKAEGYKLIGASFEVYNELGSGFLEPIYQEAFELELGIQKIPFIPHGELHVYYKGIRLNKPYIPDLIAWSKIVVELKAVKELVDEHRAQLFNYLKATGLKVGYLINFGHHPRLEYERIIYDHR